MYAGRRIHLHTTHPIYFLPNNKSLISEIQPNAFVLVLEIALSVFTIVRHAFRIKSCSISRLNKLWILFLPIDAYSKSPLTFPVIFVCFLEEKLILICRNLPIITGVYLMTWNEKLCTPTSLGVKKIFPRKLRICYTVIFLNAFPIHCQVPFGFHYTDACCLYRLDYCLLSPNTCQSEACLG